MNCAEGVSLVSTCDPQASLEHVVERPGVIVVELQQRIIFKKSRAPAAGISLEANHAINKPFPQTR